MFKEILVPIDHSFHSEIALAHAVSMARAFDSRLILLHAIDIVGWANPAYSVNPLDWQVRKAEAKAFLQDRVEQVQRQGLDAESYVLEGDAARQIYEFVRSHPVDLIVLNARGQSGAKEWNLGGVVQKLVQHVRTSILLVRTEGDPTSQAPSSEEVVYQRVLLPMDGSLRAECALPVVATLSRKHGGHTLLINIVQRPEMPRHLPLTQDEGRLAEAIVQGNQVEAENYLAVLQDRLPGNVETRVLVGPHVGSMLQQLAVQEQIDLVVLSAHGYSSQTAWTFGSQTAHFLAYGNTSVLVVQDTPS
jgi:nucleotide-binding universal stress UspA family protein